MNENSSQLPMLLPHKYSVVFHSKDLWNKCWLLTKFNVVNSQTPEGFEVEERILDTKDIRILMTIISQPYEKHNNLMIYGGTHKVDSFTLTDIELKAYKKFEMESKIICNVLDLYESVKIQIKRINQTEKMLLSYVSNLQDYLKGLQ